MLKKITEWFRVHEWVMVVALTLMFIGIRLPGIDLPLHQDEYKWPMIVNPAVKSDTEIPHPPLSQFIYREAGAIVGYDVHFRFVPLFFGAINLVLFYYLLRMRFGRKVAGVGALFFILSYFSILASLMVDTDGQIMPFFFLLALISYYKAEVSYGRTRLWWTLGLVISCILGFFIKVSFGLAIAAIAFDFIWKRKSKLTRGDVLRYGGIGLLLVGGLVLLLLLAQHVFSFFNLSTAFAYWEHFIQSDRNWFQTVIQVVKALLYTSPLLIVLPCFLSREHKKELRPFIAYIVFGLIFYIALFDFSIGALDRYMQYLIIPLCALSAVAFVSLWKSDRDTRTKEFLLLGSIVAFGLLFAASLHHEVPSLHPKSAWIARALSLKWNFLYPFSGGSGPLGFYMSFMFLALSWLITFILGIIGFFKQNLRKKMLLVLLPIALMYNGLFTEEYLFGKLYGSAPRLVSESVLYIKNNPDIQNVLVYNDNGGNEVRETGKYTRRLYADPAFEESYREFFSNFSGHILMVDIPRVIIGTTYEKYLNSCRTVYSKEDKYITAKILDCRK